jgi:hypothetical protein
MGGKGDIIGAGNPIIRCTNLLLKKQELVFDSNGNADILNLSKLVYD